MPLASASATGRSNGALKGGQATGLGWAATGQRGGGVHVREGAASEWLRREVVCVSQKCFFVSRRIEEEKREHVVGSN